MTAAAQRREAVLFLAGWWPSPGNPHDGIFIREHAMALQSLQQVAVVHLRVAKHPRRFPGITWQEEHDHGLVVLRGEITTPLRRFGSYDLLVRKAYRQALRQLGRRFEFRVAHVHVRTPVTMNAPAVAAGLGLPVVVTEHSSYYHTGINQLLPGERDAAAQAVRRWFALPAIKKVLPVSRDLGNILQQHFGVAREKVQTVPNVAADCFHPRPIVDNGRFRMVLAARWASPKDPDLFIEVLRRMPQEVLARLQVDWVGDGELYPPARDACKAWVERGMVRFPGRLDKLELAGLLAQAHLLVHPTKAENLPCIIAESLCSGTPVLSMAVNGIPELVDSSNGMLCPPGDPQAFLEALLLLMNNYRFDRQQIAQAAQQRFAPGPVARQLLGIYATLIS
ncbi:MAG: glycosyltransferase [Flavobacteriales bacterium]|nr:glycosyltransferase [Flavobacteriales bacterium]